MLESAKKYEEELKRVYFETVFDESFKWVWFGTGREWCALQDKTSEYHSFVSTYNGNVLGEMGYHKDVPARKVGGFYCCHFTNGGEDWIGGVKMNEIVKTFQTKQVRIIIQDGKEWFILKDLCDVLEHSNSRMIAERLDDDEKGVSEVYTPSGKQAMTIVNESGLYKLKSGIRPYKKTNKPEGGLRQRRTIWQI